MKVKNLIRKGLVLTIILLFVGAGIVQAKGDVHSLKDTLKFYDVKPPYSESKGYIQDLIDAAAPGDTVFISAGIYYENIVINKYIILQGENRDTTIIDGNGLNQDVILITADDVTVTGFTIQNSGTSSDSITIQNSEESSDSIALQNSEEISDGIEIWYSNNNLISGNRISNNGNGIHVGHSDDNTISDNIISNNGNDGIVLSSYSNNNNNILGNIISNNGHDGIYLAFSNNVHTIFGNTISDNNAFGIEIDIFTQDNVIYHNNLINNGQNANDGGINIWNMGYSTPFDPVTDCGNYWSDYTGVDNYHGPNQDIPGSDGIGDTPYSILGKSNQDQYPFMNQNGWEIPSDISVDLSVFLEGPFNGVSMDLDLNTGGYIPLTQPFSGVPWSYPGTEAVSSIPNADVVDWVLVELRETSGDASTATNATMIARQVAFLLNDGSVVGLDGSSILDFELSITQNLYVVLWHRNHLNVMSSSSLTEVGGIYSYDFTTGSDQAYGGSTGHKEIGTGVWGMVGGDGNADGQVNNQDKNEVWTVQVGMSGYLAGDFNLDAQVSNQDKNDIWIPNVGKGSQVPI